MDDTNIFAYTAPGATYPEYVSINRRNEEIYIAVRSPDGGPTAEMRLPYDQLDLLIRALRLSRPANLYGSGDKTAFRHIPKSRADVPSTPVHTSHLERAQANNLKKPHHR